MFQEVAGLGGDAQYLKQEAEFQVNKQLFLDSVSLVNFYLHIEDLSQNFYTTSVAMSKKQFNSCIAFGRCI